VAGGGRLAEDLDAPIRVHVGDYHAAARGAGRPGSRDAIHGLPERQPRRSQANARLAQRLQTRGIGQVKGAKLPVAGRKQHVADQCDAVGAEAQRLAGVMRMRERGPALRVEVDDAHSEAVADYYVAPLQQPLRDLPAEVLELDRAQ